MFSRNPKERIETGEMPAVGRPPGASTPQQLKSQTAGRSLTIFKSLVLMTLMAITLYGMLNQGLSGVERWLPVAVVILGLVFVALFITEYFTDMRMIVWVLVGLLATLVAVKGLSLTWSISKTQTIEEFIRSSMYLAVFVLAAASLSSRRLVEPFVDGINLIVGAIAGYGVLQKINPVEYPTNLPDGIRVDSTLTYANTVAVVLGMGIVLGLGRMTQLRNPIARGLYAALVLIFCIVLYFTFSRGGMLALGMGLVALFAVGNSRLQMFTNLLLICVPLIWLVWKVQGLEALLTYGSDGNLRAAEGSSFGIYLAIAVFDAFLLQVIYATLAERYEPGPTLRRLLGVVAMVTILVIVGVSSFVVLGEQRDSEGLLGAFAADFENNTYANDKYTSLSSHGRATYWSVAWEEWKEQPLTGTGAGTFMYTWLENRPGPGGAKQVHNTYLEQGTETGVVAFLALTGFALMLIVYLARAALRATGQRKLLLATLAAATIVYLFSSAFEWHWYIPPSTLLFFVLAGVAVRFASGTEDA